jgi:hypothetical protein
VVVRLVVNCVVARPFASLVTTLAVKEPAPVDPVALVSIEKLTGTPGRTLPLVSLTVAVRSVVPPDDGSVVGLACSETAPTAAAPTWILTALAAAIDVPPDSAVMEATPELVAMNFTIARPLTSVSASLG